MRNHRVFLRFHFLLRLGLTLAAFHSLPIRSASAAPSIVGLRAVQYEYGPTGGEVRLLWSIEGGAFDSIEVTIGSFLQVFPGTCTGLRLLEMGRGTHSIQVEGRSGGLSSIATV